MVIVCMCVGVTSRVIQEAIDNGAETPKDITKTCGAGSQCGRCRHTIKLMAFKASGAAGAPPEQVRRRWGRG